MQAHFILWKKDFGAAQPWPPASKGAMCQKASVYTRTSCIMPAQKKEQEAREGPHWPAPPASPAPELSSQLCVSLNN